jgi:hypothetical protein
MKKYSDYTKEELIIKLEELEKDYSDIAKEKLDLDWLFGNMCRTIRDYIETPMFTKERQFPLAYKVVEDKDNTEKLLKMLNPVD